MQNLLQEMKRVLIAFSGGVDSTLLLKVAKDTLGEQVLAVTAVSETTPRHERLEAERLARQMAAAHLLVDTYEMQIAEFVNNPEDKCYICKKYRFGGLVELARKKGYRCVLDGGNLDDHADYRPGIKASRELGVLSPLTAAGFSKQDVRALSKRLKLPTWNKPSYACLASRIPYHSRITPEKLEQIDAGEEFLRGLEFRGQVRVRHHDDIARLEIDARNLPQINHPALRSKVVEYFKRLGFTYVALDLEGYNMGSLNRVAAAAQKGTQNGQQ
ncbi:potassium ABC transporter ATPase [Alkalispirochaeta odontotermitis]|nr:potassium ABC transporter ATPase [Alkalispirochaeta odontotermitis]